MFREKKANRDIADHFGRQPSAIKGRLMHLGLIPNPWVERSKYRRST